MYRPIELHARDHRDRILHRSRKARIHRQSSVGESSCSQGVFPFEALDITSTRGLRRIRLSLSMLYATGAVYRSNVYHIGQWQCTPPPLQTRHHVLFTFSAISSISFQLIPITVKCFHRLSTLILFSVPNPPTYLIPIIKRPRIRPVRPYTKTIQ